MENDVPSNGTIEHISINNLENTILKCNKLQTFISSNDKTPSWDGEVFIYGSSKKIKSNLIGKANVQVKGKWRKDITKIVKEISYQISVDDLKNYKDNGGTIFFVVYCNYQNFSIFYTSLLPIDIEELLKNKEHQKSISVKLGLFPMDNSDEIFNVFYEFYENSKKQHQISHKIINNFSRGILDSERYNLVMSYSNLKLQTKEEMMKHILTHPTYSYIHDNELGIDSVYKKINFDTIVEECPEEICVDGKVLFNRLHYEYDKNGLSKIKIGKYIYLDIHNKKFHFSVAKTLLEQIKNLQYIEHVMQNNDNVIKIDNSKLMLSHDNIKKILFNLMDIQNALKKMHVKKDLVLEELTANERNKLIAFSKSILYGEEIPYYIPDDGQIGIFECNNINLLISCERAHNGKYIIHDFFSSDSKCKNKEKIDEYLKWVSYGDYFDNFEINNVFSTIEALNKDGRANEAINDTVILLIINFDSSKNKNLLILGSRLLENILKTVEDTDSNYIYKINLLQIFKRQRNLTNEENIYLVDLKQRKKDKFCKICCDILLENYREAEIEIKTLSTKEKNDLGKLPIYKLYELETNDSK